MGGGRVAAGFNLRKTRVFINRSDELDLSVIIHRLEPATTRTGIRTEICKYF